MAFLRAHAIEDRKLGMGRSPWADSLSALVISMCILVVSLAGPAHKGIAALRYGYERAALRASSSGLAHVAQGSLVTVPLSDIT